MPGTLPDGGHRPPLQRKPTHGQAATPTAPRRHADPVNRSPAPSAISNDPTRDSLRATEAGHMTRPAIASGPAAQKTPSGKRSHGAKLSQIATPPQSRA